MQSTERLVYTLGAGLFFTVLIAGVVESLRVERQLPAVDLFGHGAQRYIDNLVEHKDVDGAIEQLVMRTRMSPFEADTYEQLGGLWAIKGDPQMARAQFEQLVRLRPRYARGYELLGSTFLETQEPKSAAAYFERAIEFDPESASSYNGMGIALASLGHLPEAEKRFAKAVELQPNLGGAKINLERVRSELKDVEALK
jgi:protein O-GlcNAc transferase